MKVSLIVPVVKYSFFVGATLRNIHETCGLNANEIDFVFIIGKKINKNVRLGFEQNKNKFNFRVVQANFDAFGNHLKLIDWAIRNDPKLENWIVLQHCDLCWKKDAEPWLLKATKEMDDRTAAIALDVQHKDRKFTYKEKNLPQTHDFLGFYNKSYIIKHDLTFEWGTLNETLFLSKPVMDAIQKEELCWTHIQRSKTHPKQKKITKNIDWIDGSEAIGLEIAINHPDKFKSLNFEKDYEHLWGFYRCQYNIQRTNKGLKARFSSKNKYMMESMAKFSWISSHLFGDIDYEVSPCVPWNFFESPEVENIDISQCNEWKRYTKTIRNRKRPEWFQRFEFKDVTFVWDGNKFARPKLA